MQRNMYGFNISVASFLNLNCLINHHECRIDKVAVYIGEASEISYLSQLLIRYFFSFI